MELLSIGNELLKGSVVNTNAAFLAEAMTRAGFHVERIVAVPDRQSDILEALREGFSRTDLIVATGGLGPTVDDLTRQAAAVYFQCGFRFDEAIARELEERYAGRLASVTDQATLPEKAATFPNPLGTARPLLFSEGGKTLVLLPGVPAEMRYLTENELLPYLLKNFQPEKIFRRSLFLQNAVESEVDPCLRKLAVLHPELELGIYPHRGRLTVTIAAKEAAGLELAEAAIKADFSERLYDSPDGTLEAAVQELFTAKGLTLATAESCTGGAVAARLTTVPGASAYFLGAIVTYSNTMKERMLGVPPSILDTHGAVSEETVRAMLKGLFENTGADWGVAVSGIAGPSGGTPEKPVGTVWAAVGKKGEAPECWKMHARGDRQMVIDYSVNRILGKIYSNLL